MKDKSLEKSKFIRFERFPFKKTPSNFLVKCIFRKEECSNVKKEPPILIDFFAAEKDSQVARQEDTHADVDVLKRKMNGTDVTDRFDEEFHAEIEMLLYSPIKETTEVLSSVLDGSPELSRKK
ncbi:uncharacterized protein LOC110274096 [Arachis duranensis]|uniref:Uncharacterized protein LOC110274096 n=1 Tax=Arachis duranensis TaxID=130453 RepID=A0A9C6TG52_ARADU|nr:uncharacterized protein LOC110274096 [Arachis duranensis]XP_052107699.1 uncharacterized protein LOC110274096 [Arachis duranensis]